MIWELSVGGKVYVGEIWALTTSLQRCSNDREISLLGLIRLRVYKTVTIYMIDRPHVSV